MPRYTNREMLTPPPSRADGVPDHPAPEWGEGTARMRYDDGSGRIAQVRPRTMNAEERRNFDASIERISRAHDDDLQALADI